MPKKKNRASARHPAVPLDPYSVLIDARIAGVNDAVAKLAKRHGRLFRKVRGNPSAPETRATIASLRAEWHDALLRAHGRRRVPQLAVAAAALAPAGRSQRTPAHAARERSWEPGTRVSDRTDCCELVDRVVAFDMFRYEGPDLTPPDFGVTNFKTSFPATNSFRIGMGIKGVVDEQWTPFYVARLGYQSEWIDIEKRCCVSSRARTSILGWLWGTEHQDLWPWEFNDGGFAGVYYAVHVWAQSGNDIRVRASTWNASLSGPFAFTSYVKLAEATPDTRTWPWYIRSIPSMDDIVSSDMIGDPIVFGPGERLAVTVNFRFYTQVFGDSAIAGVSVRDLTTWPGRVDHGFADVLPTLIRFETCG